jgi:hypothetical protein
MLVDCLTREISGSHAGEPHRVDRDANTLFGPQFDGRLGAFHRNIIPAGYPPTNQTSLMIVSVAPDACWREFLGNCDFGDQNAY